MSAPIRQAGIAACDPCAPAGRYGPQTGGCGRSLAGTQTIGPPFGPALPGRLQPTTGISTPSWQGIIGAGDPRDHRSAVATVVRPSSATITIPAARISNWWASGTRKA